MPHKFYKHRLLLDEGLFPRNVLHRTNNRHNLKHIKHEYNKSGLPDNDVYELAKKDKRIIVTYNIEDFRKLATQNKNTGVIGVTQGITPDQLDTKLNSLLSKSTEKSLYGKYTSLSQPEELK
jgi:predicted nuclease of predicted toxin-antitoxin system